MKAHIIVTLRKGILDPQGKRVQSSLEALGYQGVTAVRVGKYIEVEIHNRSREAVEKDVREMCEALLANPVIEEFRFELTEGA